MEKRVRIPGLKLWSPNQYLREDRRARSRRIRKELQTVAINLLGLGLVPPKPPLVVRIVRVGLSPLDSDNAVASAKWVRDEIARYLRVDDGDPSVEWIVEQKVGTEFAVEITMESKEGRDG